MLNLSFKNNILTQRQLNYIRDYHREIEVNSLEEKVKLLILRDLLRLDWDIKFSKKNVLISPPEYYDKEIIRSSMSYKRGEILLKNKEWIRNHIDLARENLAEGKEVLSSRIKPIIEVCETSKQHDLFRILRYYWSCPYSEYVGRRIRLIIRDDALPNKPVIGIAALGSSIIHIPDRDNWIGWDKVTRTKNLIYTMDAYVIGALPPYNYLLGGKLICYILASNEVRDIYRNKYQYKTTYKEKREATDLVCIFTTSLYGKSSQYNRIKYNDKLLYIPIGETKGFGTLHLTEETFSAMQEFLRSEKIIIGNKFGDGPSWRMRVIRTIGDILGFDPEFLLKHSYKRHIYLVPLIKNLRYFLDDSHYQPDYCNYPLRKLVQYWKERWFNNRKNNGEIISKIIQFKKIDYSL
jgi:hypothetical protein